VLVVFTLINIGAAQSAVSKQFFRGSASEKYPDPALARIPGVSKKF